MTLPLFKNLFSNQKGGVPILLIAGLIGILGIMAIANLAPFKNSFLTSLYPKERSFAAVSDPIDPSPSGGISGPIVSPSPQMIQGDLNGNGVVDIFDYNTLVSSFGQTGSNLPADFNQNGKVDIFDFNTLVTNFGRTVS